MTDDIVTRLRVLLSKCCTAPAMAVWSRDLRDATDEIELLRSTVTDCRIEIERLRAERDEANANAKLYRDERDELAARCGDHGPGAHTAGPVEHFIPEAL